MFIRNVAFALLVSAFTAQAQTTSATKPAASGIARREGAGVEQAGREPGQFVETVPLSFLSSDAAARLLQPYLSRTGGVYAVDGSVAAITFRDTPAIVEQMKGVLAKYDVAPQSLNLSFDLLAGDTVQKGGSAPDGIATILTGVLKYSGYRTIGSSTGSARAGARFSSTLMSGVPLTVTVDWIHADQTGKGTAELRVDLASFSGTILSSTVVVPLGESVLVGSAVPPMIGETVNYAGHRLTDASALILIVRPTLSHVH